MNLPRCILIFHGLNNSICEFRTKHWVFLAQLVLAFQERSVRPRLRLTLEFSSKLNSEQNYGSDSCAHLYTHSYALSCTVRCTKVFGSLNKCVFALAQKQPKKSEPKTIHTKWYFAKSIYSGQYKTKFCEHTWYFIKIQLRHSLAEANVRSSLIRQTCRGHHVAEPCATQNLLNSAVPIIQCFKSITVCYSFTLILFVCAFFAFSMLRLPIAT